MTCTKHITMDLDCNYIVHEREDYIRQINVYKIGKSKNIFKRMPGYPKGSKLLYMSATHNMMIVETKLIEIFSTIFIQRKDRGREYFQGDYKIMKGIMDKIIDHYDSINPFITDKEIIERKIKASVVIQRGWRSYLTSKKNKNDFSIIKNFLNESRIINKPDSFLKVKEIRLLWNASNDTKNFTNIEISNYLSPFLGKITIQDGILGWKNKAFYQEIKIEEIKKDVTDDKTILWNSYVLEFIIKDENECIHWHILREHFRKWHDDIKKIKPQLSKYAIDVKDFFDEKLDGFTDSSFKGTKIKGFYGWKLINYSTK